MAEFVVSPRWTTPPPSWTFLTHKRNAETQKWWQEGHSAGRWENPDLFPKEVLARLNNFTADGHMWATLEKFSVEYKMKYSSPMVFHGLDGFTRLALHWYAEERGVNHESHWEVINGVWDRVFVLGTPVSRL